MQTFLPYQDFRKSAQVLDNKRLGKQRVECLQILRALTQGGGWKNHPAVKMWKGREGSLQKYGMAICEEWIGRGFRDTTLSKIQSFEFNEEQKEDPEWLGDEAFHKSHKSNLLRKDPKHYAVFQKDVSSDIPYVWPVVKEGA